MNESVVERSLDVAHTENVGGVLAWSGLGGTVVDDLLFLLLFSSLLGSFGLRQRNNNSLTSHQVHQTQTHLPHFAPHSG